MLFSVLFFFFCDIAVLLMLLFCVLVGVCVVVCDIAVLLMLLFLFLLFSVLLIFVILLCC